MNRFNEQIKFLARKNLVQHKRRKMEGIVSRKALENQQSIRTLIPNQNKENNPVCSIKVMHPEGHPHFSGVMHLLTKVSGQKHPERKHLQEPLHIRPISSERRHNYESMSARDDKNSVRSRSTLKEKVKNDLKSELSMAQFAREVIPPPSHRKRYLNAVEIDTNERARRISSQKLTELTGNGLDSQPMKETLRSRRTDFLRSSFKLA